MQLFDIEPVQIHIFGQIVSAVQSKCKTGVINLPQPGYLFVPQHSLSPSQTD